mmetsp:Transcript_99335/g.281307  ORF Transcript_99335/g.281307 Transcript_99335/m.281307 type:complete len:214 (+) Transcript_99335:625-1266(+)
MVGPGIRHSAQPQCMQRGRGCTRPPLDPQSLCQRGRMEDQQSCMLPQWPQSPRGGNTGASVAARQRPWPHPCRAGGAGRSLAQARATAPSLTRRRPSPSSPRALQSCSASTTASLASEKLEQATEPRRSAPAARRPASPRAPAAPHRPLTLQAGRAIDPRRGHPRGQRLRRGQRPLAGSGLWTSQRRRRLSLLWIGRTWRKELCHPRRALLRC